MIYLDNAATGGRKPESVISAVSSAIRVCANPGRSGHKLAVSCAMRVNETREALSDYFSAYGTERVVFTKNCTEALNLALSGIFQTGDHVVTTCMEHNSVLRPLERLKAAGIVEYDICPLLGNRLNEEALLSLVKPNTRAVVVTSASNVTGATPNLKNLRKRLPERVLFIVDGAQGGGHLPIRMKEWGVDALALAGHKGMMGIQGSGALLFSERLFPSPVLYGGTGSESYSLSMPDFYPDALEAGTLSFPAVLSLYYGVRYLEKNAKKNAVKLLSLTKKTVEALRLNSATNVYSEPNECGIVAFAVQGLPSEEVATILSERYFIAVRGGLHCAPLMHKALKTEDDGLVRASFSPFTSEKEVDELLFAVQRITHRV